MQQFIQIDVKREQNGFVDCNLQTGGRDVRVIMSVADYHGLISDGFFIRDGKKGDSAGVINTTHTYYPKKETGNE